MGVEAGDEAEVLAAVLKEGFFAFHADFLDGLEAIGDERGAGDDEAADTGAGEGGDGFISVRLAPFLVAEAGLERGGVFIGGDGEALDEVAGGFNALVAVADGMNGTGLVATVLDLHAVGAGGITFEEVAFGDAVVAEEEVVPRFGEVGADGGFKGVEVKGVIVEGIDDGKADGVAEGAEFLAGLDHDGLKGGHGVVGVEGDHEDFLETGVLEQFLEAGADGGVAVAHAEADGHGEAGGKVALQSTAGDDEGGAFGGPDVFVGVGGFLGAGGEDEATDDEAAEEPGHVDDALVHEKFIEIAADIGDGGGIGGTEVDEEDGPAGHRGGRVMRNRGMPMGERGRGEGGGSLVGWRRGWVLGLRGGEGAGEMGGCCRMVR